MSASIDDLPKVMGDDGEFHATDEAVDLSGTPVEAWVALGFFWLLGGVVFYQFFTRYVINDSAAWTEEIARYLLIAVVFTGATIGVIKNNHIQVDFFYRYMPARMGRVVATAVGGIPDLVEDGSSALLVPPDDVDALAKALWSVTTDADLRHRLGDAALATARERFDVEVVRARFDTLYRELLTHR